MSDRHSLSLQDIQQMLDGSPFIRSLGVKVEAIDQTALEVRVSMPMQPHLQRGPGTGQYHGGAIASLIDIAGDFAVALVSGAPVPTINFRVDFLRPAIGDSLGAVARARRVGRTVGVVDIDVFDPQERLCAVGRGTYSVVPG